jgi:uncharacterized DUF497 family protein
VGRYQSRRECSQSRRKLCSGALAFRDPFAVEWIDLREAYSEERIILLGMTSNHVLTVVYTERAERIRIISARRATKNEQEHYYSQNAS